MIIRIIIAFLIFLLVAILAVFLMSGAIEEIAERKNSFENPLAFLFEERSATSSPFNLSLDPIEVPAIKLSDAFGEDVFISADPSTAGNKEERLREELIVQERRYDALVAQLEEAKQFGEPSPRRGEIEFSFYSGGTMAKIPSEEYVRITANAQNTAPINISGWSLQSVISGTRVFIPTGVKTFTMGGAGNSGDIYLDPGGSAVIVSGASPVGVSFKENSCTGYLEQFQTFTPLLGAECPLPSDELPATIENIRHYGNECLDFVETLPQCTLYLKTFPNELSSQCQTFVKEALTYNGCVARHQWRPSFEGNNWRIFLAQSLELWNNSRDVIRLLDEKGRTVDVLSY